MLQSIIEIYNALPAFMMVLARISSFVTVLPLVANVFVPLRIRLLISVALSILVFNVIPAPAFEFFSLQMIVILLQQVLIGIASGYVFTLVFELFVLGGHIISMQMGLGFATLADPRITTNNLLSQVYWLAAVLIFLQMNGHLMMVGVFVKSFYSIPISSGEFVMSNLSDIVNFASIIYSGAISIALPAIISLLIVNIMFAVMSRTAPQMNIFAVGFSIMLVLGLLVVYLTFVNMLENAEIYFNQGGSLFKQTLGM
jgi:flagellar biosynthetic protein FliR